MEDLDELPKSKLISQAAVLLGSLVGIFFAFHMTDILDAMIIFNYPYMGSLLIPLLGGLVWKGATRKGAFAAVPEYQTRRIPHRQYRLQWPLRKHPFW